AQDMGGQISIAQIHPAIAAQAFEIIQYTVAFICQPPAFFGVDLTGQGIGQCVYIRGHPKPMKLLVSSDITDNAELTRLTNRRQDKRERGAADSAGEQCDTRVKAAHCWPPATRGSCTTGTSSGLS